MAFNYQAAMGMPMPTAGPMGPGNPVPGQPVGGMPVAGMPAGQPVGGFGAAARMPQVQDPRLAMAGMSQAPIGGQSLASLWARSATGFPAQGGSNPMVGFMNWLQAARQQPQGYPSMGGAPGWGNMAAARGGGGPGMQMGGMPGYARPAGYNGPIY